jgi:hypothetical protein
MSNEATSSSVPKEAGLKETEGKQESQATTCTQHLGELRARCQQNLPGFNAYIFFRDDDFLLQALRSRDFVVEEALEVITNFVNFRRGAGWSLKVSAHSTKDALRSGMHWLLPSSDRSGRAVLVYNLQCLDQGICSIEEFQMMGCYLMEEAITRTSAQENGVVLIVDFTGVGLKNLLFGPSDMLRGVTMWQAAFPCKLKQVFICNLGGFVGAIADAAIGAVTQLLHKKLRDRVQVVSDLTHLHAAIDPSELPVELGGSQLDYPTQWAAWVEQQLERERRKGVSDKEGAEDNEGGVGGWRG